MWYYNHTPLYGRIIQAVQISTIREVEGVLIPGDICAKTGILVREVLQKKHPPIQEIDNTDTINSTLYFY